MELTSNLYITLVLFTTKSKNHEEISMLREREIITIHPKATDVWIQTDAAI